MRVTFVTRPGPSGPACGPFPRWWAGGGGSPMALCQRSPGVAAALPPLPPRHSSSHSRVPDLFLTCMPCACTSVRSAHMSVRSVKEEEGCRGHSLKVPGKDSMEPRLWPALKVVLRGLGHDPLSPAWAPPHTRQPSCHSAILGTEKKRECGFQLPQGSHV